jgi:DNA-binding beta-propeller fold protein YncE
MALLFVVSTNSAFADNVANYLFVASQNRPEIAIIDSTADAMVGRITLPGIPGDMAALERGHSLAIADRHSSQVRLVDVLDRRVARVMDVPLVPDVIRSDRTGSTLAALDLQAGKVSLSSTRSGTFQMMPDISGATYIVFDPEGRLLVAHQGGVTIVDPTERPAVQLVVDSANGLVTDVAVDPGGEYAFVEQSLRGILSIFDTHKAMRVALLHLPAPLGRIIPSQDSQFIIVPTGEKSISVVSTWTLNETARANISAKPDSVGLAFFQSVAAIISHSARKVILYDLWNRHLIGEIQLPGRPGSGAASSDGSKFYVTLPDSGQVASIDLTTRRIVRLIDVGDGVWTVVPAVGNGYCH